MSSQRSSKERRPDRVSSARTGTRYKFCAVNGNDEIIRLNGISTKIRTKACNICAMPEYEMKSMEELRFEDYINNRKFPSSNSRSSLDGTTVNPTNNIFNSITTTTSSTLGLSLFENKPTISTASRSLFAFGPPISTTAVTTPNPFCLPTTAYSSIPFGDFVPGTASIPSPSLFTLESRQQATTATSPFNFALAVRALKNYSSDSDEEKTATIPRRSRLERKSPRTPSPDIVRECVDCKKLPQMQCLHCSKQVCMDCAQKHVALSTEQVDVAQQDLTNKLSILDRLSTAAKERVNAEREKIIQQADTERDQAFIQIDQLFAQQKKQIEEKSIQLSQLSLDKISSHIQRMTIEMEDLNEDNDQLFCVTCSPPKIQVQHKH